MLGDNERPDHCSCEERDFLDSVQTIARAKKGTLMFILELLQEGYGWKQYSQKFKTYEEAEKHALNLCSIAVRVKDYKIYKLTKE